MNAGTKRRELVEVGGLRVTLGGSEILHGVTAGFPAGQLSAILGPNGAGKSTLVRALLGIVPRAAGHVHVAGRLLESYRARELARTISFVPQDTHLDFSFRVDELVMMGRYPHLRPLERERPADRRVMAEALERLHLNHLRHRDATTLSAGERQRVLVARALATEARILVADEPVSNLDIGHRLETVELLRELARGGHAVIVVLHDIDLALRFADRVLLLNDGLLVKEGSPQAVADGPDLEEVFDIEIERRGDALVFHRRRRS